MEIEFPISLVAANGSAKGDDGFGTSDALARPDLNPQAVPDTIALPCRSHSAFVRSIATPNAAPLMEPASRAFVVGACVAILRVVSGARRGAWGGPASRINVRIV